MAHITSLYSLNDIEACVDMYRALSDEEFMPTSREVAIHNLWKLVRMKKFVRCIRKESKIIAWMYADKAQLLHTDYPVFQQMYYASNQSSLLAARCVVQLHDKCKQLKLAVDSATTPEEVKSVKWD